MTRLLSFLWILVLLGCQQGDKSLSPKAFQTFCSQEENGLVQSITKGPLRYSLRYLPTTYQALKTLNFQVKDSLQFQEALQPIQGHHYLNLQIAIEQPYRHLKEILKEPEKWSAIKSDLLFHYQNRLQLRVEGQNLPCQLYHGYALNNDRRIELVMVFKAAEVPEMGYQQNMVFQIEDWQVAGTSIQIEIDKAILNNIPSLKI